MPLLCVRQRYPKREFRVYLKLGVWIVVVVNDIPTVDIVDVAIVVIINVVAGDFTRLIRCSHSNQDG